MSVNTDISNTEKQNLSQDMCKKLDKMQTKPLVSKYLGQGTYGIIIADPRLPSEGETWDDLIQSISAINQVSKVIKDTSDLDKLNKIVDIIHDRFSPSNLAQLQTQIVIPSRPQRINWYSLSRASFEQNKFLKSQKITKRLHKWHYIIERGTSDLDIELRTIKTVNQLKYFLKSFGNIIDGLAALHSGGLAHTDIKLTNMIVSWDGRYKLIDLDELSDTRCLPTNKYQFEKIYNNVYYPYYPMAGVFLWSFSQSNEIKITDKVIQMLITNLVKKNYDKDYNKYYTDISKATLSTANDPELSRILQTQYSDDQGMMNYLIDFSNKIISQPYRVSALRELLLFIDRYSLGINLLILLGKYYRISGQISDPTGMPANQVDTNTCEFIPQSLISLIKLCCNADNYGRITTQQIAAEYDEFITQLFISYPYKFIIKLLSGLGIRRKSSQG